MTVKRKHIVCNEGDVFLVHLESGREVFGVVTRRPKRTSVIIYVVFYDRSLDEIKALQREEAEGRLLRCQTGDLGFREGQWHIVGRVESWSRESWPLPEFWREVSMDSRIYVTKYDEDTLIPVGEWRTDPWDPRLEGLPKDVLHGDVSAIRTVQMVLDGRLSDGYRLPERGPNGA